MFDKNVKVIDVRFIGSKTLLIQILKLINYIQHALDNSKNKEIVLTLKIRNLYGVKLLASINDSALSPLPCKSEMKIGE